MDVLIDELIDQTIPSLSLTPSSGKQLYFEMRPEQHHGLCIQCRRRVGDKIQTTDWEYLDSFLLSSFLSYRDSPGINHEPFFLTVLVQSDYTYLLRTAKSNTTIIVALHPRSSPAVIAGDFLLQSLFYLHVTALSKSKVLLV